MVHAVATNKQSLILMAASVVTMIDEKIEQLKGQTPNDQTGSRSTRRRSPTTRL
jgi:hypothetical protein